MDFKEDILNLIESLDRHGYKRGDLEREMGYSDNSFDQAITRGGNKKLFKALSFVNKLVLRIATLEEQVDAKTGAKVSFDRTLSSWKPNVKSDVDSQTELRMLAVNLETVRLRQMEILAEIKGGLKYRAEVDAKGDQVKLKASLAKVSKYAGDYLHSLKEADTKSSLDR
jgi:hypothetical protein